MELSHLREKTTLPLTATISQKQKPELLILVINLSTSRGQSQLQLTGDCGFLFEYPFFPSQMQSPFPFFEYPEVSWLSAYLSLFVRQLFPVVLRRPPEQMNFPMISAKFWFSFEVRHL